VLLFIAKCVTQAQFPAGIFVKLGTPLSVAYVANKVLVEPDTVLVTVTSPVVVPIGDHCLYVGVPNALFVFKDSFK
jgi:hypothetical protein